MTFIILFLLLMGVLLYQRASLFISISCVAILLIFASKFHGVTTGVIVSWIIFLVIAIPLVVKPLRRKFVSQPIFRIYQRLMPSMSRTERAAIAAGTITWEGDLFCGKPNWHKLLSMPAAKLSAEEQAFLEGPVDILCQMLDDWDITHNRADLPPAVWQYIKEQGFFALIIPKQYGGKAFSAYAHSQILTKVSSRSITASSIIAVPNSLGPAELLLHYGTEEQKNYYLPRLARGEEIPCFALTSPTAGSDAGSMTDHGIVCWGEHDGNKVLGLRLTWQKRYITLAPIATVIGLAFKMYDPQHLLGKKEDMGITCALIPRTTPGITIGRRHFPLNAPFQNGPIEGNNVFIPLTWIIGGVEKAGEGWQMLMECLAAGRAISLPANALGGAKIATYASGAYARIRRQFGLPIGRFEGVEEPLARIGAYAYIMDATRTFAAASIDAGAKPAVASAIVKYHVTELGRVVACDTMDIHGGKGICLGPHNYLGRNYQVAPIAITVEGANILTRNMIIFGQGAMRCHPYVLPELQAAEQQDLNMFDKVVMKHAGFMLSNAVRTLVMGLSGAFLVKAPKGKLHRYYQQATRFSSVFAFLVDICMLTMGSQLKRKESISARLGDILSYLYLLSAVFKHYHDQGEQEEDLPLVRYAGLYCLFMIQERCADILKNFPKRGLAWLLKILIFPFGQRFTAPRDILKHHIAQLLMAPTETRQRLASGAFLTAVPESTMADIQDALLKTIAAEPVEKIIRAAHKESKISGYTLVEQAQAALDQQMITLADFDICMQAHTARHKVIAVDDFTNEDLIRNHYVNAQQYA